MLKALLLAFWKDDVETDRRVVKEVLVLVLELGLQVANELVFPRQFLMTLKVVKQMPRPHVGSPGWSD